ncbi:DDE-type integrase/transposase/recombinase [Rhodococcus sp. IEGM 1379]|nr:DDE-type integrase/transposase/recombinase [Rhodococcus sp. IEGM 1379]MDI9915621.1 DDE-type integrase/transposase/recombinase [Rhodococcus sp. IEGM 1379]
MAPLSRGDARALRELYYRFRSSVRDVEAFILARGIVVSYETPAHGVPSSGGEYAVDCRLCALQSCGAWYFDEVFIKIGGRRHYLWRAFGQERNVFDIAVKSRRSAKAAYRSSPKLMRTSGRVIRVLACEKLASYVVAHRKLMSSAGRRRRCTSISGPRNRTNPSDSVDGR